MDAIIWVITNIGLGFYNFFYVLIHITTVFDWSDKINLVRFIHYGASVQSFFVVFDIFLVIAVIGFIRNGFLWGVVRVLEGFANIVGRTFAWAGLLMVLQQIVIVFLQRIFRVPEISFGPFSPLGYKFLDYFTFIDHDLSWYAEELKLYNAMIVALCVSYTFVQGSHVRVDLFYAGAKYRTKKIVDMLGSLLFIVPSMTLIWLYGWYFMWRHLITPKVAVTNTLQVLERKAPIVKWNIETIAFSPNGYDHYIFFKVLLIAFPLLMVLQAMAFFFRSYLELKEGPDSEGKYLDKDNQNDELADKVAEIH